MTNRIQKMNSEWNNWVSKSADPFVAVGRNHSEEQLSLIIDDICMKLQISNQNNLLDVGCGTGVLVRQLKTKVKSIKGVDFSEKMIEVARRDSIGVDYFVSRSDDLPFEDNKFDRILCYSVFHYFDDYHHAFKTIDELIRCCSSGGLILVGDIPSRQHFDRIFPLSYKIKRWIWLLSKGLSGTNRNNNEKKKWHEAFWIGKPSTWQFYNLETLKKYADQKGCIAKILEQSPNHQWGDDAYKYRFDLLISKK